MFEHHKKHSRGRKTFVYLFIVYGWWLALIGIIFLYLAWSLNFGGLYVWMQDMLANNPNWIFTPGMISQWALLLGLSFLLLAYVRVWEMHHKYKFMLDEHAFHVHRGILFIHETTIPYHQISSVHVARPYHYRLFGLAQLDIVTAADKSIESMSEKKKYLIPIIDISIARPLSQHLLKRAAKSKNRQPQHMEYEDDDSDLDDDEFEDDTDDTLEETDPNDEVLIVSK
jgi:membrane protein YdbS with pleckstrin-like domain